MESMRSVYAEIGRLLLGMDGRGLEGEILVVAVGIDDGRRGSAPHCFAIKAQGMRPVYMGSLVL